MFIYRCLRAFLRVVTRVFFRQIEVVGLEHVPGEGPVIFAGNHPNSLIDPVMILTTCGRVVSFAAKDTLFKNWLLRAVLTALGAVPIARREDHQDGARDNERAFAAMFARLGEGGTIGIFPEGISHDASQLARLRTGAARLAFGAAERHPDRPVRITPCGLTFVHPKRFRSRVLVQYGTPLEIGPVEREAYAADAKAAVRALTERLDRSLRALTVNAEDWDTVRVLDGVRRLYQPPAIRIEQRVELARRFNDVYPKVRADPRVASTFARVKSYLERLEDSGFTDRDLRRPLPPGAQLGRVLRCFALVLLWLPLALPGMVLHAPIGIFASVAGRRLTPRKDVIATTKLLIGLLLLLAAYLAVIATIGVRFGAEWALFLAASLPLSGYATLKALGHFHSLRRTVARLVRVWRLHEEWAALRRERAELEEIVVRLVDEVRPADMVPLFPRPGQVPA
jgi:1-acyl-sn-glycerol-3-phosphate acyltransferase